MPVSASSTKYIGSRITVGIAAYLLLISIVYFEFPNSPWAITLIYIISLASGSLIVAVNEWKIFPVLMKKELEEYSKDLGDKVLEDDEFVTNNNNYKVNLMDRTPEFILTQYDYYIQKTTLSQKLGSVYLLSLLGGVLIDISLNAVAVTDITRTVILMILVSIISLAFHVIVILKHAEYNAGCVIYRNAMLGITLLRHKFPDTVTYKTFTNEMKEVLINLRCRRSIGFKKECKTAARKTIDLLILLGILKPVQQPPPITTPTQQTE